MRAIAAAGEVVAQPGIDQGLAQRRCLGADQRVGQHLQRQRGLDIDDLVEHPVNGDIAAFRISPVPALIGRAGVESVDEAACFC